MSISPTGQCCKEQWLRGFLRLENGVPSHDTLNRLFRLLDPKTFESVFRAWVADTLSVFSEHIALDGKSLRGAHDGCNVHMVSAFATESGLVLAQESVPDKAGNSLRYRNCYAPLNCAGVW